MVLWASVGRLLWAGRYAVVGGTAVVGFTLMSGKSTIEDALYSISVLFSFLLTSLDWIFFLISSPEVLFLAVLTIIFGVAMYRSDNIFSFLIIVFTMTFGFFGALIKLVVLILGVLISMVSAFRGK